MVTAARMPHAILPMHLSFESPSRNKRKNIYKNIQLSDKKIRIIVSLKLETFLELCHKLFYEYIKPTQVFKIKKASDFWYIILSLL